MAHKLGMNFTSQFLFNLVVSVHRRFSFFDNSTALAVSAVNKFSAVFVSIRTLKDKIHVRGCGDATLNLVQFEVPRSSTFAYCPDQDEVKSVIVYSMRQDGVGGWIAGPQN